MLKMGENYINKITKKGQQVFFNILLWYAHISMMWRHKIFSSCWIIINVDHYLMITNDLHQLIISRIIDCVTWIIINDFCDHIY